jgi:tRNA threonylcarbamoyladenosine modification (KEOPS) complex  Pcc1 subunit
MTVRWKGEHTFSRLTVSKVKVLGGATPQVAEIVAYPLNSLQTADGVLKYCGMRAGALNITAIRLPARPLCADGIHIWDGNPDEGLKIQARNYANNLDGATRVGGERALNIQARNSGLNLSWVKAMEMNARNDSGKNVSELHGLHVRAENYGNVFTDVRGVDIEISDENTTQSQERMGLVIRSTDLSGMPAVNEVFKILHTSTNGFTNLIKFGSATGDTYTAKATAVGSLGNTLGYAKVDIAGTPGRIAIFDEWA